ncbi:hypothetical protein F5880DRAFT_1617886 [Lentinula raphanica]|nr:hypothetical protein F5880DRAFT_1617886 [Lentinula raphanica]
MDESAVKEEFFAAMSGAAALTLEALRSAAALAPIPYLSEAATLAIDIWVVIQTTKNTKASLHSLASDAISLVHVAMTTCDEILKQNSDTDNEQMDPALEDGLAVNNKMEENDESPFKQPLKAENMTHLDLELLQNLQELHQTLQNIEKFAKQVASRSPVLRFLTARADAGKVIEFQNKMKLALDLFMLKSHISLRQVTGRIETQQVQLLTALQSPTISPMPNGEATTKIASTSDMINITTPTSGETHTKYSDISSLKSYETHTENSAFTAFPAVFSFDGATFHTGDTHIVHNGIPMGPHKDKPIPKEKDYDEPNENGNNLKAVPAHEPLKSEARTQSQYTQTEYEKSFTPTARGIQFTSIAGDQNISQINDQSQRWNFGNTYTGSSNRYKQRVDYSKVPSTDAVQRNFDEGRSHDIDDLWHPTPRYNQSINCGVGNFVEAWSGLRKPVTNSQPKEQAMVYDYNTIEYGVPLSSQFMNRLLPAEICYNGNNIAVSPLKSEMDYHENGIPTDKNFG